MTRTRTITYARLADKLSARRLRAYIAERPHACKTCPAILKSAAAAANCIADRADYPADRATPYHGRATDATMTARSTRAGILARGYAAIDAAELFDEDED